MAEGSWGTDGPSGDCRTETAQRTNTRGCCDSQRGSQKWQGARVKGGSREASRQSQGVRVLTGKASVRVPSAGLSVTDVQMSARLALLPPSPGKWLGERQGGQQARLVEHELVHRTVNADATLSPGQH